LTPQINNIIDAANQGGEGFSSALPELLHISCDEKELLLLLLLLIAVMKRNCCF